jgi:hypothetical protein
MSSATAIIAFVLVGVGLWIYSRLYAVKQPLPKIPEAVVPGTPLGIEVLKAWLALSCLFSLIGSIPGLHPASTEHFQFVASQGFLSHLLSLGYAVFSGLGLYGIHRRMRVAWRAGWICLGLYFLYTPVWALTATNTIPPSSGRWVAFSGVVLGSLALTVYWGYWWNIQKRYFRS